MPKYIIKLTDNVGIDYYMEWSTIVDAPVTYGMSLEEFKEYYQQEYGNSEMRNLSDRLERVEATGCSTAWNGDTLESFLSDNRAGPNETKATVEEIIEQYCHNRPEQDDA